MRNLTTLTLAVAALPAAFITIATAPAGAHQLQSVQITPATPGANFPKLTVVTRLPGRAAGYLFAGVKSDGPRPAGSPAGPMIVDDRGRPVWFQNLSDPTRVTDVRTQSYLGRPVLTYWQGSTGAIPGVGDGLDYILDQHYHVIRAVQGRQGLQVDLHEFLLTPDDTAIIEGYRVVRADATAVGGAANQAVLDGVVQEISMTTGRLLFQWHSIDHVPLTDSYTNPAAGQPDQPWDYFHLNSVKIDTDRNLIISGRHTWAVYKVDRHTGNVIWRLGGKESSFAMGRGTSFRWQHDVEAADVNVYRIFDNHWNQVSTPPPGTQSRVLWVRVDPTTHQASRAKADTYPVGDGLLAGSQGNAQRLANGNVVVDWGAADRITEFRPSGQMVLDSYFPSGFNSYRAYRGRWVGTPTTDPSLRVRSSGGSTQFDVVWNGATTVARWRVLGGSTPGNLQVLGSTRWNGYDTAFTLSQVPAYVRATAFNGAGRVVGRTAIRQVG